MALRITIIRAPNSRSVVLVTEIWERYVDHLVLDMSKTIGNYD